MARKSKKIKNKALPTREEREILRAKKMLRRAEMRAQRTLTLVTRWRDKLNTLESAYQRKLQPSLFEASVAKVSPCSEWLWHPLTESAAREKTTSKELADSSSY
jgi:hypothetical protein